MASITKVQLRTRVAKRLKVYSKDIELDAATAEDIDEAIDDTRAELKERSLCWWGEDAIPQAAAFALELIVAARACAKVGKEGQGYESGDSDGRIILSDLKRSADISTLAVDYF